MEDSLPLRAGPAVGTTAVDPAFAAASAAALGAAVAAAATRRAAAG